MVDVAVLTFLRETATAVSKIQQSDNPVLSVIVAAVIVLVTTAVANQGRSMWTAAVIILLVVVIGIITYKGEVWC
jgi:cytochrome b